MVEELDSATATKCCACNTCCWLATTRQRTTHQKRVDNRLLNSTTRYMLAYQKDIRNHIKVNSLTRQSLTYGNKDSS
jgi:hypothetical protein